jgi:hypothetical protein
MRKEERLIKTKKKEEEELSPAPPLGVMRCGQTPPNAPTATTKGGGAQSARLRVDDYAKCAVSLAELSAVSLGEP